MLKLEWKESVKVGTHEADLNVTLVSEEASPVQTNVNGTEYRVVTIELENKEQATAIIYEKNYSHGIQSGTTYRAKAIYDPQRGDEVLIQMSHLPAGNRIKASDLGFNVPNTSSAKEEAEHQPETSKPFETETR